MSCAVRCPSLLTSPAFLPLLRPMVTTLHLSDLPDELTSDQFAAICELTNLEELYIAPAYESGCVYIYAVSVNWYNWSFTIQAYANMFAIWTFMFSELIHCV